MAEGKIFVGRKAELEQFKEVLKDPKGQAVLVVGQTGMGKTWLVNKMSEIAENHPKLKCGWVRYEVTKEDSVDSRLAIMIDDAFEVASNPKKFWGGDGRGKKQWIALYKVLEAIPSAGKVFEAIRGLAKSLKRDISKDSRQQFVEKLNLISKKMPSNGRAIFIVDPEKYMRPGSDEAWAIVVKELPEKIKFVFAQRPEDVLVDSETFGALDNVSQIPEERLDVLEEESVDELINQRVSELKYSVAEVREVLSKYKGHPYALQGSMDLLKAGTKLEELPKDPTGIAAAQWKELSKRSREAIRLFKAYAILEVGVQNEVVEAVSELDTDTLQSLLADNYLGGLLREEGEGKRIYHAILADYIIEQIVKDGKKQYHSRAVKVYRGKLEKAEKEQIRPDALAAVRLAEHVLEAEGKETFVNAFVNECYGPLTKLGLLDTAISLSERALGMVEKDTKEEASVTGNLGLIYRKRGELDKAEDMHLKSLEIEKKLGRLQGMASDYGNLGNVYVQWGDLSKAEKMYHRVLEIEEKLERRDSIANAYGSLGLIYYTRGELDKAEEMYKKSLEIDNKIGRLEGMVSDYGNLGIVYKQRGELDKAEEMYKRALENAEKIGHQEMIGIVYGNLGNVYQMRGELNKAEEMHLKSLDIAEKLGLQEVMASQYGNLGGIYKDGGDIGKAKEYWEKALELYKRIGMPHKVNEVQGWIEGIDTE